LNEKNRDTRERQRERERDTRERVRLKDSSEMKKRVLIYILVKKLQKLVMKESQVLSFL
jgi:hypothetical protein